jgi:hypothetical protein
VFLAARRPGIGGRILAPVLLAPLELSSFRIQERPTTWAAPLLGEE